MYSDIDKVKIKCESTVLYLEHFRRGEDKLQDTYINCSSFCPIRTEQTKLTAFTTGNKWAHSTIFCACNFKNKTISTFSTSDQHVLHFIVSDHGAVIFQRVKETKYI